MLGKAVEDYKLLRWPMYGSPKLDGIRAIWFNGVLYSRTLKPIPNKELQAKMRQFCIASDHHWNGLDGELIYGSPTDPLVFNKTTRAVMKRDGPAEGIVFYVFDRVHPTMPFSDRLNRINILHNPLIQFLEHRPIASYKQMLEVETEFVECGYEGLILRNPFGKYKMGRSTTSEQGLVKVKRFEDAEAEVVGFEERMHNANSAKLDERGYTKRSSHKENQIATNSLGSLVVRNSAGVEFQIGTGFTDAERAALWHNRSAYLGKMVKYKFLPVGVLEAPRHPVFLGWRED